jgi:hypothetical protein
MGIEDPGWGRIIIVIFFIAVLLGFLYFSKNKGKNIFSHLAGNEFLKLDGTIALSNISKASLVSAENQRFLIVHGRGQSPAIVSLETEVSINAIKKK